jgi:ketosteroid isomerase-like protein
MPADIATLLDRWVDATRDKDIDRLMSLYAPEIVYFDVVPPLQFAGLGSVRANFMRWFDTHRDSIGVEIRNLEVVGGKGDGVAFAHMLYRACGTLKTGRQVGYWVRATVGCRRTSDGWQISHEHISLPVDFESGRAAADLAPP